MRKYEFVFGLLFAWAIVGLATDQFRSISATRRDNIFSKKSKALSKNKTPIHKALLTQRGYIQFLRWELPVPEIEEFTFCLWLKSTNLTHSHSIFSYSKDEKDRYVRAWISPYGQSVHLAINEIEIVAHPANIQEHRWYHVCQSWENKLGRYALWIDGRKETEGRSQQLVDHVIPSNGDIVVGQEYTDFDRGLEEGIEGAVLGFNLILSSAFSDEIYPNNEANLRTSFEEQSRGVSPFDSSRVDKSSALLFRGASEGIFEQTLSEYLPDYNTFGRDFYKRQISGTANDRSFISLNIAHESRRKKRGTSEALGLQLVNIGYDHCQVGRGSPFVGGSLMLISWTRTPMRVFGGAIMKNANSECGNF